MQEEQIIRTEYSDLMKKSYIDYAMSVIIARALPDVRDGLQPGFRITHGRRPVSLNGTKIPVAIHKNHAFFKFLRHYHKGFINVPV